MAVMHQKPEEYMYKYQALNTAVAELRKNVERLDQFCREFEELIQSSIKYLLAYQTWWLQRMQKEKDELFTVIEAAVQETSWCLDQGIEPVGQLSQVLWNFPPEKLQIVIYSIKVPDWQALCESCTFYQNRLQELCESSSIQPNDWKEIPASLQESSSNAMIRLAELSAQCGLSEDTASILKETLQFSSNLGPFEPLLQKISEIPQVSAPIVEVLVNEMLKYCEKEPEKAVEWSARTIQLLERKESTSLLANLAALTDSALVASILTIMLQHNEEPVLVACTELSQLLSFFERDQVPAPNFRNSLLRKPAEFAQLAETCINLLKNPANVMAGLCGQLVEALEGTDETELLLYVATLAVELQQIVPPDMVENLGLLLMVASKDTDQMETVKKLRIYDAQVRESLIKLLNGKEALTVKALEQIFPVSAETKEFVKVTDNFIRFLDLKNITWGPEIYLRRYIRADKSSRWIILEDGRVFCSGGGKYHAGYFSKSTG